MKILILEWKSYCLPDIIDAFQEYGHEVTCITCQEMTDRQHPAFARIFEQLIEKYPCDLIFTFNYFPIVSVNCNIHNLTYVSWVYDNPLVSLYSYTVLNPCNYIFLFDYKEYCLFHEQGISTIYYLPLCANPKRLSTTCQVTPEVAASYCHDVSFVGSLYTEPKQRLYDRLDSVDDYTHGFLDALVQCQSDISGYFFLDKMLNPQIVSALQKVCPLTANPDGAETPEYLYSNYFLGRKSTALERQRLLSRVSSVFDTAIYTWERTVPLPQAHLPGPVDYYNTMPLVFSNSRINLNITLKTIQTGVPLRVWDIIGCKGFLISNYQEELCQYFLPDAEFVFYESEDDLLKKIDYYLSHEKERLEIAHNGYEKLISQHTFLHRMNNIMEIISN